MDNFPTEVISATGLDHGTVQDDIREIEGISILLQTLIDSVRENVEQECLENAISLLQAALEEGITVDGGRMTVYHQLIRAHLVRYSLYGWTGDLNQSSVHLKNLVDGVEQEDVVEFLRVCGGISNIENVPKVQVATQLINVFESSINVASLDSIVCTATEALVSYDATYFGDKLRHQVARLWIVLGKALVMKYLSDGDIARLHQATRGFQQAESICLKDTTVVCISSLALQHVEWLQFIERGDIEAFKRLWSYQQKAIDADAEGANLYEVGASMVDNAVDDAQLQEGITFLMASLHCRMDDHPQRCDSLDRIARAFRTGFERKGYLGELEISIALEREVLNLHRPPHPNRSLSLDNLASSLLTRFEHKGAFEDLEECIALRREASDLCQPPHPNRPASLNNLASSLSDRFKHKGAFEDLEECIALHRQALGSCQQPHLNLSSLNNLANSLWRRFEHKGVFEDLEESIALLREALALFQPAHPNRFASLNNLANCLATRFEHKGAFEDLEECITLYREALHLDRRPRRNRFQLLNNLAKSLWTRFRRKGAFVDLEECIALYREALNLLQSDHPNRYVSLNNLALSLETRFKHKGAFEDLAKCIALLQEALNMCQTPHPDRSTSLNNLAGSLVTRFKHTGNLHDIEKALDYFQNAAKYPHGSPIFRLQASNNWATSASNHCPNAALDAYKYSMELLPQIASLDLTLQQRQDVLQHGRNLVGNAAKSAIDADQCELAVTFLSIGRSIFWSQALHLRSPVDDLMGANSDIAQRFILVSRQLEDASYSQHDFFSTSSLPGEPNPDIGTYKGLHLLASERQKIIEEIRTIPGYESFLQSPSFPTLQRAAKNGPVILLSVSKLGCDVLIVRGEGSVQHIPLPGIDMMGLLVLRFLVHGPMAIGMRPVEIRQNEIDILQRMLGRDMVLETSSTNITSDKALQLALEVLWIAVVRPVIDALRVTKTDSPGRLWWCPTGLFSSLPIHAAGIYSNGKPDDCLFQYAISSYCTSPQDLLHPPPPITQSFKVKAIIEPEAPRAGRLPATLTELDRIMKHVPDQRHLIAHVGSINNPNQVKDVVSDIQRSSFVHFGCHGKQNLKNPLESLLLLSGGNLTMSTLIKDCQVPEGALAYLSACETAKGDDERPDESLNLVATMMFAGFRGVVGTLWSILDNDAPIVADVFYQHLFRKGRDALPDALLDILSSSRGVESLQNNHTILYNEALASSVANFTKAHPDAKVITFDAYSWFNDVLDNAQAYNFTNILSAPSDPRNTTGYFWLNSGHPTEAVHKLLAKFLDSQLVKASK